MLQLAQLPVSLYSFKVRLAVAIMGIDLPLIEPHDGTYRSPSYKAVVPPATIPALLGPDGVITESDAIIEYLDETMGNSKLMSGPALRRARARMLTRLVDLRLEASLRKLFGQVPATKRNMDEVKQAREQIDAALEVCEWAIAPVGPFAVDGSASMADCSIAATSTWLDILQPLLMPDLEPGPRFRRVVDTLRADAVCGPPISDYRQAVAAWADSRQRT